MLKKYLGCLAFVPVLVIAGESGGVFETNYGAGLAYSDSRNSSSLRASGNVSVPVYKYIGSTLFINGRKTEGEKNTIDTNSYRIGGTAFLRDFDLGKVGIGAAYNKTNFDSTFGISLDETELYQYSLLGQYYLNDFTIGADRTTVDSKDFDDFNSWTGSIAWYWQGNTKLLFSGSGMDAKDSYGISASHQPEYFNNSTEITFAYSGSKNNDVFSLSVNYYFGTLVSLIDRDRKYR